MPRIENDSLGEILVPDGALWGAQTQRALENFNVSGYRMPRRFNRALALIKAAAARANAELGHLEPSIAMSIVAAAEQIARGDYDEAFVVDVFQTGSGTSSNMNANEVIAHLASDICGHRVDPNDHVNMSQSSNDVIPSAIQIAVASAYDDNLHPAIGHLAACIHKRSLEFQAIVKTGRTHLMDAMPLSLGQEFSAWEAQLRACDKRLRGSAKRLRVVPLGGTAIGTGINADAKFAARVCQRLSDLVGYEVSGADNRFAKIAALDDLVEFSGQLRTLAVCVMKIANDLRWMNSGPLAGLGEIELPALQPGSSIMPGKVNPVVPESAAMVCAHVMALDVGVGIAGQSGNFQLNVMMPLVAHNVLESIRLMKNALRALADKCIRELKVKPAAIDAVLARNPVLVTALNPIIGYAKGAAIAKRAYAENRPVLEVAMEMTGMDEARLRALLDPMQLAQGGLLGGKAGGGGG